MKPQYSMAVAACILLVTCVPSDISHSEDDRVTTASPSGEAPSTRNANDWSPGADLVPCSSLSWQQEALPRLNSAPTLDPDSIDFSSEDRLANGMQALRENAIGIVRVRNAFGGKCTGTLIDSQWVLTAAHCAFAFSEDGRSIIDASDDASVHIGQERLSGGLTVPGLMFCHAEYGMLTRQHVNDLALIRLKNPVTNETPVKIVRQEARPMAETPGRAFSVYGFGRVSYERSKDGTTAREVEATALMTGPMTVSEAPTACANGTAARPTVFCADTRSDRGSAALCRGDSGGPAFVSGGADGRRQVGVNSFMTRPTGAELQEILEDPMTPAWLKKSLGDRAVCGVDGNRSGFVDLVRYREWMEGAIGITLP